MAKATRDAVTQPASSADKQDSSVDSDGHS